MDEVRGKKKSLRSCTDGIDKGKRIGTGRGIGMREAGRSEDDTLAALLLHHGWLKCSNDCLIKHIFKSFLGEGGTLDIFDGTKFSCEPLTLLAGDRPLLLSLELFHYGGIVSQIYLRSYDEAGHTWAVMVHLREPLFLHVFERGRGRNTKADKEDVGLWVGERAEAVVVLLTGGIEQAQCVRIITNHYGYCVVVEYCRDIFTWEFVGGVRNEQAGLSNRTITDNNAFDRLHTEM